MSGYESTQSTAGPHMPQGDAALREEASSCSQGRLLGDMGSENSLDLVLRLTLVMTLLFASVRWYDRAVMQMGAACGLISPRLARRPIFWLSLAAAHLLLGNLYNWDLADNHQWLFTYWYMAVGLSLLSRVPEQTLGTNARLLIGLTFLFAVLRKALSSEYMSGAAFRFLLQVDSRFFEPAKALAGHTQNASPIWRGMAELEPTVPLMGSPALDRLAMALTWWTLAIEVAIAGAFLVGRPKPALVGHLLLMVFVATTYPIAPVLGFAGVLLIMGLAHVDGADRSGYGRWRDPPTSNPDHAKLRFAYMAALVLMFALQGERLKITLVEWWFGNTFFQIEA